jgi:hypothetical protein
MRSTTRVTDIAGLLALCGTLWYALRPSSYLIFIAANAVFAVATVYAALKEAPEARQQPRHAMWLAPLGAAVVGALWVAYAAPEDRMRALAIAAGLVVTAGVIVWARRHVT